MLSHTRTQNDKNMFKYGVCISMFLFTFCYSTISLAVPFTTVKVSGALTNFCPFVLSQSPKTKKCGFFFFCVPTLMTVTLGGKF